MSKAPSKKRKGGQSPQLSNKVLTLESQTTQSAKVDKTKSKYNPNVRACYDALQVLKVWDRYVIQSKDLRFFCGRHKVALSLFQRSDCLDLIYNAGLLITKDNTLYENKENTSISICSSVDIVLQLRPDNTVTHSLEVALYQLKSWNENEAKIRDHIVLFPYHVKGWHWCLGQLELTFKDNTLQTGTVSVIDPQVLEVKIDGSVQSEIVAVIQKVFSVNIDLIAKGVDSVIQQADEYSGGVISAENGKDVIDGTYTRRAQVYPHDARELRIAHLEDVSNSQFDSRQSQNQYCGSKDFVPPKDIIAIGKLLQDCLDEGFVMNLQDAPDLQDIEKRVEALRNFVQNHLAEFRALSLQDGVTLFDRLFFNDAGKVQCKDGSYDVLCAILEPPHKSKAGGLKKSLHGNLYQWSLLTWTAFKADEERKSFILFTERDDFEKYDDLVLKIKKVLRMN